MGAFEVLKERGFIQQLTHEDEIKEMFEKEKIAFYIGFDPTADSLHVGHYLTVMAMSHMQKDGHLPIALMGGGTGMVGDPTDKTDMRPMLTVEEIDHNIDCFKEQFKNFFDFNDGKAIIANNADWLGKLNYIDFIREYGVHFSVNKMLAADAYKMRLERGLSFFELNYMIMQAYDFLELNRRYGCRLQMGGNDQWSNIIAGVDLIRRVENKPAYGMTVTLLTTQEGIKMGKTQNGAVWLDAKKTSPYEFFQYWRNVDDADVKKCLSLLTFMPMEQVNELAALKDSAINEAKEALAFEITKIVHGAELAEDAKKAAKALFGGGVDASSVPTVEMKKEDFENGIALTELLEKIGIAPSRSEARRLIQQGGITIAGDKVTDVGFTVVSALFTDNELLIQKGKKVHKKIKLV